MPSFSNARETVINAAPASVHALLNDFCKWQCWSPWEGLDPNLPRASEQTETAHEITHDEPDVRDARAKDTLIRTIMRSALRVIAGQPVVLVLPGRHVAVDFEIQA